jgi:hypothetical protein
MVISTGTRANVLEKCSTKYLTAKKFTVTGVLCKTSPIPVGTQL